MTREVKEKGGVGLREDVGKIDVGLLKEPKARAIDYSLATYPDVVHMAFRTYEPGYDRVVLLQVRVLSPFLSPVLHFSRLSYLSFFVTR